jgi:act minimal PKS acyl carrier protein
MDITIDGIRQILLTNSGAPDIAVADADFADTTFDALGYDSLALMESAAAITREHGVRIGDEALYSAKTPRELLAIVESAAQATA